MSKGISIHIGLNEIDPSHYGTTGSLRGCENDARTMQSIAATYGYDSGLLLTRQATAVGVLKELSAAADRLAPGDTLLVTYAGHGSQIDDLNADELDDKKDETWCLYDRMLLDDELYRFWCQLQPGVRVVVVSDSCHSESVTRFVAVRRLDPEIANSVLHNFKGKYEEIKFAGVMRERAVVSATVITLAACKDTETAGDGASNGIFTGALLKVWNRGSFKGNYEAFLNRIASQVDGQRPKYSTFGLANPTFINEQPFTIAGARVDTSNNGAAADAGDGTLSSPELSVEEQLALLKKSYKRSLANELSEIGCKFELDVDPRTIKAMDDAEVYDFLRNDGCDVLMKAYLMTSASAKTSRGLELSCRFDEGGSICGGGFKGSF